MSLSSPCGRGVGGGGGVREASAWSWHEPLPPTPSLKGRGRSSAADPGTHAEQRPHAYRSAGPEQELRRHHRGRPPRPCRAPRRAGRADRPERVRQDDDDQHAHRASDAGVRPHPGARHAGRRAIGERIRGAQGGAHVPDHPVVQPHVCAGEHAGAGTGAGALHLGRGDAHRAAASGIPWAVASGETCRRRTCPAASRNCWNWDGR